MQKKSSSKPVLTGPNTISTLSNASYNHNKGWGTNSHPPPSPMTPLIVVLLVWGGGGVITTKSATPIGPIPRYASFRPVAHEHAVAIERVRYGVIIHTYTNAFTHYNTYSFNGRRDVRFVLVSNPIFSIWYSNFHLPHDSLANGDGSHHRLPLDGNHYHRMTLTS